MITNDLYSFTLFPIPFISLGVEQGESGFVKSLIGRHETIKREKDVEIEERRRSRVYSSCEDVKGVVPTKSTTFANVEKPEVRMFVLTVLVGSPFYNCCFKRSLLVSIDCLEPCPVNLCYYNASRSIYLELDSYS